MRSLGILCLLALLCLVKTPLLSQRYSHVIDQKLNAADLRYMPVEKLNLLKNEIIALRGAQTNRRGTANANPYAQNTNRGVFLNEIDEANLTLIDRMMIENSEVFCSLEELFDIFLPLARSKRSIPLYLAEKFYGIPLDEEMTRHQRVVRLSDELLAIWVPEFSDNCEICPYRNHFITINSKGERTGSLEVEGLLTVMEENIVEVKNFGTPGKNATTKPEYYQIMDNGQLISKTNQVVQVPQQPE